MFTAAGYLFILLAVGVFIWSLKTVSQMGAEFEKDLVSAMGAYLGTFGMAIFILIFMAILAFNRAV